MSEERSPEDILDERSGVLTRQRLQDEGSNEIAHIKAIERLKDDERAEIIKDIERADVKDIARADIKDIARAEIKDILRSGLSGPNGDLPQPAPDRVAADIFRMATSLGGYMVVGVVVPMAPTAPPSLNGGNARIAGLTAAGASDREQKAAAARRTIEQMTEGALRQRRRH